MNAEPTATRTAARRTATLFSFGGHQVFAIHMTPADAVAAGVCHSDAFFVVHMADAPGERGSFRFAIGVPLATLLTVVHERFQSIPQDIRVSLAHNLFALAADLREGVVDPHQDNLEKHLRVAEKALEAAHEVARAALVQAVGPTRAEQMIMEAREARTTPKGAPCPACARMSTAAGGPVGCPAHEPERYLR